MLKKIKMPITKILLKFEPKKENLLKAIKEINYQEGFISEKTVEILARYFSIKPVEVFSVASFYDEIKVEKPTKILIQICNSANCCLKNSDAIIEVIENFFHQKSGDENQKIKIEKISCLGRCLQGPNVVINGTIYEKMNTAKIIEILRQYT